MSRSALVAAAAVGMAGVVGALVAVSPVAAAAFVAVVALVALLTLGSRITSLFQGALLGILAGYAFLDKGFSYVGVPPLYIGEMVLVLALIAIALALRGAHLGIHHGLILAFMLWGATRTIPYLGQYGLDALRDAATWYYAIFAIAVSITIRPEHFWRLARLYRRVIPVFLLWLPVAAAIALTIGDALPKTPGSNVPILEYKAGDASVQLVGVAAFLLLGLDAAGGRTSGLRESLVWAGWVASLGLAAALNRSAILVGATIGTVLLFVRASTRWLSLAFVTVVLVVVFSLVNPQVEFGLPRNLSVGQLVDNLTSVFVSGSPDTVNEATKEWRIAWWNKIVGYTADGPYFWTGKGFGINLANDDGFQVLADQSLRAPHSTPLEILARAGVPGLVLWLLVQVTFGAAILRAAFRAYRRAPAWVPILGWIFVYWLAALVDGSFDVYLGSPHGGIAFWSVVGLGIAAMRFAADQAPVQSAPADAASYGESRTPSRRPAPGLLGPIAPGP